MSLSSERGLGTCAEVEVLVMVGVQSIPPQKRAGGVYRAIWTQTQLENMWKSSANFICFLSDIKNKLRVRIVRET